MVGAESYRPSCPHNPQGNLKNGGNIMKSSTEDKIKGEKDKVKGNIKEGLGKLTGNKDLEQEGKEDKLKGKAKKKVGEVKEVFNH
jgi:uncharacterized protein YjbJ (UPF0337 family)